MRPGLVEGGRRSPAGGPERVAGWYEIVRLPTIVGYLDTARRADGGPGPARIWFRFVYATPMPVGADTAVKYAATEAREELDCGGRRTKDLEVRLVTPSGISTGAPMPTPTRKPIDTHPLNSGVFLVAYRALGTPIPARPGV